MDLRQLEYFKTTADEGSISAAAKKLYIAQPSLSSQIRLLENELGCVLFERGARHITLTEAGKILYSRAETIIDMSKETRKALTDYRDGDSGSLRIGIVSSLGSTALQKWISSFVAKHPKVRFEVSEGNTYQLLKHLKSGTIEAALVRTPFTADNMKVFILSEEPMLAAGHKRYFENLTGNDISPKELAALPLIIYRRWENIIKETFEDIKYNAVCTNDDARTTALWADAGMGVGILPYSAADMLRNPDTIFKKISDPRLNSSICAVHNPEAYISVIAKRFIEHVQASISANHTQNFNRCD